MNLNKGDIVLVQFPFTDLSQTKLRPALVLLENAILNEVTLCFISSQNVDNLSSDEFALDISDPVIIPGYTRAWRLMQVACHSLLLFCSIKCEVD